MRFKVHKLGTDVAAMWAEPSMTVRDAHRKHCNGPAQVDSCQPSERTGDRTVPKDM